MAAVVVAAELRIKYGAAAAHTTAEFASSCAGAAADSAGPGNAGRRERPRARSS